MVLTYADNDSPLGTIRMVVGPKGLCSLDYKESWKRIHTSLVKRFGPVELVVDRSLSGFVGRLERYLAGELRAFDGARFDPGGTEFQRRVWEQLLRIRPGRTISYGELARRIGNPKACRAVGTANGKNPISIAVPCHRVIASDGSLGGYGGGLRRKRWLLHHEGGDLGSSLF